MVILQEKEGDCIGKVIYLLSFLVQPYFANIKCDVFNNGTSFLSFLLSSLTCMLLQYAPIISHYLLSLTMVRILEWVAISFSRGSSNPGIKSVSLATSAWQVNSLPPGKPGARSPRS